MVALSGNLSGSETALKEALARAKRAGSEAELYACAEQIAEHLLDAQARFRGQSARGRADRLARMMADRPGQVFTTLLTDRAYRAESADLTLTQCERMIQRLGVPRFLSWGERCQLNLLSLGKELVPQLTRRRMLSTIEKEIRHYVHLAEPKQLQAYLSARERQGVQVNVNRLGEEVLGEGEADRRMRGYAELLQRPFVGTISIKASSIFSQLDVLAFEPSVDALAERLRRIYRSALQAGGKLVYLDMESYRDLHITLAAYQKVLGEDEFLPLTAGVVLQAYLPESFPLQRELTMMARRRLAAGGSPLRLRIVKGANLAAEAVDSSARGLTLPIYGSKLEVDASFKRMLAFGCDAENAAALNVGVASHNLFDLGLALARRARAGSESNISFELLNGMAEPLVSVLASLDVPVLVYSPVVDAGDFPSAIAYLVRRLDENTAPENFIHQSFGLAVGDPAWSEQLARFRAAVDQLGALEHEPRRAARASAGGSLDEAFSNVSDTDFCDAAQREQLAAALSRLRASEGRRLELDMSSDASVSSGKRQPGFDPSEPGRVPYEYLLATESDIESILCRAAAAAKDWRQRPLRARAELLLAAARELQLHRFELIALMVEDAGKRADEADAEVSEAIDFAEYYARSAQEWAEPSERSCEPLGPILVTPPWNFPLAIPMGSVFAPLVMGNPVILKPALETPAVARRAAELLWQAGVPREVLQFVICTDDIGTKLITDERVRAVVLTGATATARLFTTLRPRLRLFAETGGKNAMYVSPMVDREQAVKDIVASAFGHAGQKCSALSQLIVHEDLYRNDDFLGMLADATRSLPVGSAWDMRSRVTPLIQAPSELQRRALTTLELGERWLVEPVLQEDNPNLVSPGIKLGVAQGSFSHVTEFFCPMLSVLTARDITEGLQIANSTAYGLTSGIHSLDEVEQRHWEEGIMAGNVYVNRKITGAIVRRQAFGGWKASSFGFGAKAGGPNYVAQFATITRNTRRGNATQLRSGERPDGLDWFSVLAPTARRRAESWLGECAELRTSRFAVRTSVSELIGEDNYFGYRPRSAVGLVVNEPSSAVDLEALICNAICAAVCGVVLHLWVRQVPVHGETPAREVERLAVALGAQRFSIELDIAHAVGSRALERVRFIGEPTTAQLRAAHTRGVHLEASAFCADPQLEMLNYLRERSCSVSYHRYGNLGVRALRATP